MVCGPAEGEVWQKYQHQRLLIEKDEPPPYQVLDLLCRNELLRAEGFTLSKDPKVFFKAGRWQRLTCQVWLWTGVNDHG